MNAPCLTAGAAHACCSIHAVVDGLSSSGLRWPRTYVSPARSPERCPTNDTEGMRTCRKMSSERGYHCDGTVKNPKIDLCAIDDRWVSTTMTPKMTPLNPMAHSCIEGYPSVPPMNANPTWKIDASSVKSTRMYVNCTVPSSRSRDDAIGTNAIMLNARCSTLP